MILIISTCREPLHELEFVNPIERILSGKDLSFFTKHYSKVSPADLKKADKVIICGTSLKDNQFIEDKLFFGWIKSFDKPLLGICAGMQIICVIFNGKIKSKQEIGFYKEIFKREFLGVFGEQEVYHLHNNYCTLPKGFEEFTESELPQAMKCKSKKIYGVLFHPEVRNQKIIENFCKL